MDLGYTTSSTRTIVETETIIEITCTQSNPDGSETTYIERKVKWHKEIMEKVPKTPWSHIPTRSVDCIPRTLIDNLPDNPSLTSVAPTCNAPRYPTDVPHPKQITLPEGILTPNKFYVIMPGQEVRIFFDWCIPLPIRNNPEYMFMYYLGIMLLYGLPMSVVPSTKATQHSKTLWSTPIRLTMLASCAWCPSLVVCFGRNHKVPQEDQVQILRLIFQTGSLAR